MAVIRFPTDTKSFLFKTDLSKSVKNESISCFNRSSDIGFWFKISFECSINDKVKKYDSLLLCWKNVWYCSSASDKINATTTLESPSDELEGKVSCSVFMCAIKLCDSDFDKILEWRSSNSRWRSSERSESTVLKNWIFFP